MTGIKRLKEMVEGQTDSALKKVVDYLLSRSDLDMRYLNEEKNLKDMAYFIQKKGKEVTVPNWNYINDEVVYSWAVMYFCFPNSFLKITSNNTKSEKVEKTPQNNVVSLEKVKEKKSQKDVEQISLFGGPI